MKILRVIASMNPSSGGPCQGIRNSIPELEKLGVHNEVVCMNDPSSPFLANDPFPIHALGPAKSPWNYSAKLIPWLIDNFKRFDAIIVHGLWLYHGYAVRKAYMSYKEQHRKKGDTERKVPKLYIMPHGMLDPYFQKASGRGLKAKRNWLYWKLIEAKVINEAEGVLFTCEEELKLARSAFRPYSPNREINVGYGIAEPPKYTEAQHSSFLKKCAQVKNRPYILFLSRIHEKKGVDLLINAYEHVYGAAIAKVQKESLKEPELVYSEIPALVIAGPGMESPYGIALQEKVTGSENLRSSVFFTGMLSGNDKWGAYYGSEAFILPSHQENFGIAVVEALACEKPVLISNKVNIWKEIETSKGGLVANDSLEGTIELLKSWSGFSDVEKQQLAQGGFNCYNKFFAIKNTAKQLKEVLQ